MRWVILLFLLGCGRGEDPTTAAATARDLLERAQGDSRRVAGAKLVLLPWWDEAEPPGDMLLLRAYVKQHEHDFDGALEDLARALRRDPGDAQAWLTQAAVQALLGRHEAARASCLPLTRLASELVVSACLAAAERDAGRLREALARAVDGPAVRRWAREILAELETTSPPSP